MPIAPALRRLEIDLPACPRSLIELALLLGQDEAPLGRIAALIEGDMALAAAVVRSVNSAHFGLLHRVGTVAEALQHLGLREVAALTYAIGLRGAFPRSPLLDQLWTQAGRRGRAMGSAAGSLGIDPWQAHTAGLFAEVGSAALHAHDPAGSAQLRADWPEPGARAEAEIARYGVSHAALGGALCQVWGLAAPVAEAVRQRPLGPALLRASGPQQAAVQEDWAHEPPPVRRLLALLAATDAAPALHPAAAEAHSALDAQALAADATWRQACGRLAEPAGLPPVELARAVDRALAWLDPAPSLASA